MNMRNTFELYFARQREYWWSKYMTLPQIPYNKAICECMIIKNSLDDDGYIQWQPIPQEINLDFSNFEKKLNFSIHHKIKGYFNSYWFLSMIGEIADVTLNFVIIPYGINLLELLEKSYAPAGNTFFDDQIHFEIGNATIDGDDSYLMYLANDDACIKCVQPEDNTIIKIGFVDEVISTMEVGM